jgi:hypothetical protein
MPAGLASPYSAEPVGTLLEMGRIPREDGPDEPFALLLSFKSAEDLRAAIVQMRCTFKFQE